MKTDTFRLPFSMLAAVILVTLVLVFDVFTPYYAHGNSQISARKYLVTSAEAGQNWKAPWQIDKRICTEYESSESEYFKKQPKFSTIKGQMIQAIRQMPDDLFKKYMKDPAIKRLIGNHYGKGFPVFNKKWLINYFQNINDVSQLSLFRYTKVEGEVCPEVKVHGLSKADMQITLMNPAYIEANIETLDKGFTGSEKQAKAYQKSLREVAKIVYDRDKKRLNQELAKARAAQDKNLIKRLTKDLKELELPKIHVKFIDFKVGDGSVFFLTTIKTQGKVIGKGECRFRKCNGLVTLTVAGEKGTWKLKDMKSMLRATERKLEKTCTPFNVRIVFQDDNDDKLFTPADEARIQFIFENNSESLTVKHYSAEVKLLDPYKEHKLFLFKDKAKGESPFEQTIILHSDSSVIAPQSIFDERSENIQAADEDNPWVIKNLIEDSTPESGFVDKLKTKPRPEMHIPLKKMYRVTVHGDVVDANGKIVKKNMKLFDKELFLEDGDGGQQNFTYPDLISAAGKPGGSAEELKYFSHGDQPYWCHPTDQQVRRVAIRAARYNDSSKKYEDFPDNVKEIVNNVVYFVHRTLAIKEAPKPEGQSIWNDKQLAEKVLNATLSPTTSHPSFVFICQENSLFLGSLLRALGFMVREINIYENWYSGWRLGRYYQDAASEVWHDNGWHFWALFADEPFATHRKYAKNVSSYDVYEGVGMYKKGLKRRFSLGKYESRNSPYWRFKGWGDSAGFYKKVGVVHSFVYFIWSPVTAVVTLPNGQRVGAKELVKPNEYNPLKPWKSPSAKVLREVPSSYFSQEGAIAYTDKADPATAVELPLSIIIPSKSIDEINEHHISLLGTGDGEFTIEAVYLTGERKMEAIGKFKGEIVKGQKLELWGKVLKAGPTPASPSSQPSTTIPPNTTGGWQDVGGLGGDDSREPKISAPSNQDSGGFETVVD